MGLGLHDTRRNVILSVAVSTSQATRVILRSHTQRNLFEILLTQTEIRLHLPFSGWFGTKRTSVWFQSNRKMVNAIWFRFDLIRFRKDFSVCREIYFQFPVQLIACLQLSSCFLAKRMFAFFFSKLKSNCGYFLDNALQIMPLIINKKNPR